MSFKQLNPGNLSAARGAEVIGFSFRLTGAGSNPTNLRQCRANAVVSVTYNAATGKFLVQLNKPYPRQLVAVITSYHKATGITTDLRAEYVRNSYSSTTGQFQIEVFNYGTEAAAPALSNGAASDEVSVWLFCNDVNGQIET